MYVVNLNSPGDLAETLAWHPNWQKEKAIFQASNRREKFGFVLLQEASRAIET